MWLYYYRSFTQLILENISCGKDYDPKNTEPTINHWLIQYIMRTQCEWLEVAKDLNVDNLVLDTCGCIGECLYEITLSDKVNNTFKIEAFDKVLNKYFELMHWKNARLQSKTIKKILMNPVMGFNSISGDSLDKKTHFFNVLQMAWRKFDKYTINDKTIEKQFQEEVIDKYFG